MNSITIETNTNQYDVHIGEKIRHKLPSFLPKDYQTIMIVTDSSVANLYLEDVKEAFPSEQRVFTSIVPAGEVSKSKDAYFDLITDCIQRQLDRHSLIIALGGGVVGDLAGFVAATYMRGIDYVQVPTTILAHDSSVGGKVAINHPEGKNLIGSFYPPVAVIYDVETLYTLPEQEIRSGYAEVVKHGLISDEAYFESVLSQGGIHKLSNSILTEHLLKGIKVKAEIVEKDEKEHGIRQYLNFGHTLGHALEAELGYGRITHGEAVAVGMLFAMKVSEVVFGNTSPINKLHGWLKKNRYPMEFQDIDTVRLVNRMKIDKKSKNQQIQMVLLKKIGQLEVREVNDELLLKIVKDFFRELVMN
ncbi:3-dehydroquinate synthase [Sediminibacillus halophilus]|uniref:3-dehydroquinate synthase n=1 Tax=Sediminibacillus halophilus TaxID=482461 RepID=A0A1G9LXF8_9BACI|nr:3-dehydroquinate synthase [Sediminibacillus halophilus]SDL66524.1 3-dehydroquinate synthase [Sediminibacillus halophilus]